MDGAVGNNGKAQIKLGAIKNRERVLKDFTDAIGVDSPSFKERKMAELLKAKLAGEGLEVREDGAGAEAGGECGNLIAVLRGDPGMPAAALLAHMDTVIPCGGKRWTVEGDIVRSDGRTILGGDDAAGIAAALEVVRRVKEEGIRHGDILVIFTIAEEVGLVGAKRLDTGLVKSVTGGGKLPEFCFVFDSGSPIGSVVSGAPTQVVIKIEVDGVAAHAGIEPEKGVNAIVALSGAIAAMPLGRIDGETTANIGMISGGHASNVVCGKAAATGEARSHDPKKLDRQIAKMRECVDAACGRMGASYNFDVSVEYEAFSLPPDSGIIRLLADASKARGYEIEPVLTGGGSDANVLNSIGVPAANLPAGMHLVHGTQEYADLRETAETIELTVEAFRQLANR